MNSKAYKKAIKSLWDYMGVWQRVKFMFCILFHIPFEIKVYKEVWNALREHTV